MNLQRKVFEIKISHDQQTNGQLYNLHVFPIRYRSPVFFFGILLVFAIAKNKLLRQIGFESNYKFAEDAKSVYLHSFAL